MYLIYRLIGPNVQDVISGGHKSLAWSGCLSSPESPGVTYSGMELGDHQSWVGSRIQSVLASVLRHNVASFGANAMFETTPLQTINAVAANLFFTTNYWALFSALYGILPAYLKYRHRYPLAAKLKLKIQLLHFSTKGSGCLHFGNEVSVCAGEKSHYLVDVTSNIRNCADSSLIWA